MTCPIPLTAVCTCPARSPAALDARDVGAAAALEVVGDEDEGAVCDEAAATDDAGAGAGAAHDTRARAMAARTPAGAMFFMPTRLPTQGAPGASTSGTTTPASLARTRVFSSIQSGCFMRRW